MAQIQKLIQENQKLKYQLEKFKSSNGLLPYIDDSAIKGGYHVVKNISERDSIDCCHRKLGMKVLVIGSDLSFKEYILKTDNCKENIWKEVDVTIEENEVFLIEDYSELSENLTTQKELNLILKQLILNLQTQIDNIELIDEKVQITENTDFAQIGESQKDFNKSVSDYKINSDLKNQEQDDRLTSIEGDNITQYDLINDLNSELQSEKTRNDIQDSALNNLEGIYYVWSPTNRTLTLYDREGTQLSQVSLVSLDNEGTDIRYNASTLSLELYNADNELLDSIPVSSFIGSVGTQLQLNSNQLQLKDSQGNILSTVNFSVSNINGLQTALDTKFDKEKFSSLPPNYIPFLHSSSYFFNSPFYVDTTNYYYVGLNKTNPTEYLDVNGNIKAIGFKTPNGIATQALTANGSVYDLTTKADLVNGKVPKVQSQPSTMVMNNSTYVITFTDATGAVQTIDLPLESLFQDANYDETTKSLIITLQDGTTRTIPLSDLVDLPEIVLATTNPAVTPTTGQKVWFNTSLGKVWFNVSGVWTYSGNLITDAEKIKLANTSGTNTGDETNTTIINKIGYIPENILNKSSNILLDKASSIKYPTVKSVYDYVQPEFNSRLKSYAYDNVSEFPMAIQPDAFFIDRKLGDVYIGWSDPNYFGDPGLPGGTYYKKIGLDINTTDLVYYYNKNESDLKYLPIKANSSTGTLISFTTDKVYGTLATPETGNITADVTNAKLGVTNIIIHNSATAPTFGSEFKKLSGSGNYTTGVVNYIYCTYISTTEIIYSINQRT